MSSDESPAVVELPDDAIEAAKVAVICAARAAYLPLDAAAAVAVAAAGPVVAARVRAEAVVEREAIIEVIRRYLPDALPFNTLPEIVGGIARQRDFQHELKDHLADVARRLTDERDAAVAEAVADEQRRIVALIDAARSQAQRGDPMAATTDLILLRRSVLAGSVPVAEKNPFLPAKPADGLHSFQGPADLGGNSRCKFCGAYQGSVEGQATCEGEFKQSGKMRAWAADRWRESLAVPVAAQLQPERVGFGTDAFETGGSLPGQPVVTPTEPKPGSDEAYRLQARLQAENRLVATLHGRSDPCRCPDCAASPVPAEQPPTCEHGRTTKHVYGSPDESDYGLCPGPAGQPEER